MARPARAAPKTPPTGTAIGYAPAAEVALAAFEFAEFVLDATEEVKELPAPVAELVMDVACTLRELNLEESDEAEDPVAVASSELMELIEEPTLLRAIDSFEDILNRTELPLERTDEITALLEEKTLLIPLETAEAAEDTDAELVVD